MVHAHAVASEKINGVMVRVAAQEYKEVLKPVGYTEAEDALIELRNRIRIRNKKRHMTEFQRSYADAVALSADIAPFGIELDDGSFGICKRKQLRNAERRLAALFTRDSFVEKLLADCGEI